jgi:hypothetical protein
MTHSPTRRLKITLAGREGCAARFDVREPTDNWRHYIGMPRYHFHIVDGVVLDTLVATLPTDEAARVHAEKMAHRVTRAQVRMLREKAVKVTGETGATLFLVPIRRDARTES